MRTHALVTPPAPVLADLADAVQRATRAAPHVPWLPRNEWHVKLAYFGNLSIAESTTVRATLDQVATYCPPLQLRLRGIEAVPGDDAALSLRMGLVGAVDELCSLAATIPALVRRYGLFLDRRSFTTTITLAQSTRGTFDARAAAATLATYQGVPWVAREMRIVRWQPGSFGEPDDYVDVQRYAFTAPGADGRADPDHTAPRTPEGAR